MPWGTATGPLRVVFPLAKGLVITYHGSVVVPFHSLLTA